MNAFTLGQKSKGRIGGFARVGAVALMIVGAPFVILSLIGFMSEERRLSVAGLLFLGILGLVICAAGIVWLRSIAEGESQEAGEVEERALLELAEKNGGAITVAHLVRHGSYSSAEAEAVLERMTSRRLFYPDLMEDGTVVYRSRGLT